MSITDGQDGNQSRMRRLQGSIPASYTIFKVGTTYYAESCIPGGTDYSGTNASTVIQAALDGLPNGGKIAIKEGLYTLSAGLTFTYTETVLEGEGVNTELYLANNANVDMITIGNMANCGVKNLYLNGNKANNAAGHGVRIMTFAGDSFHDLSELYIKNVAENSVYITSTKSVHGYKVTSIDSGKNGFRIGGGDHSFVSCIAGGSGYFGFLLEDGGGRYMGCKAFTSGAGGVEATSAGWYLETAYLDQLIGCDAEGNASYGFILYSATCEQNILDGCWAESNGRTYAGSGFYLNACVHNQVLGGFAVDTQVAPTQDYGLEMVGAADYNTVKDLDSYDNQTGNFNITATGIHNRYSSVVVPFIGGTTLLDSGYEIDLDTEYAIAWAVLPQHVQKVVSIKVYARTLATEADAMRLEINVAAGSDNEAYTAENIAIPNSVSISTNFTADDVIYWRVTFGDDADIGHLVGGDSVEIKILHEAAGGADCATDASFRTVEIEYV